jgi:hypothetical protein
MLLSFCVLSPNREKIAQSTPQLDALLQKNRQLLYVSSIEYASFVCYAVCILEIPVWLAHYLIVHKHEISPRGG